MIAKPCGCNPPCEWPTCPCGEDHGSCPGGLCRDCDLAAIAGGGVEGKLLRAYREQVAATERVRSALRGALTYLDTGRRPPYGSLTSAGWYEQAGMEMPEEDVGLDAQRDEARRERDAAIAERDAARVEVASEIVGCIDTVMDRWFLEAIRQRGVAEDKLDRVCDAVDNHINGCRTAVHLAERISEITK